MQFLLASCAPDDMDRAFEIFSEAFAHDVYFNYIFPQHDSAIGRKIGAGRLRSIMRDEPNVVFIKAMDIETGTIVGISKWIVYDGDVPEETELDGEYWDNEADVRLAQDIKTGYLRLRRQAIKDSGGRLVSLDVMAVHPQYQRRGAGRMLLRWGVELADTMGVEAVVEASKQGKGLYEQEGFKVEIDRYVVPLSEEFSDRETETFYWMKRPAKVSEGQ